MSLVVEHLNPQDQLIRLSSSADVYHGTYTQWTKVCLPLN